MAKPNPLSQGLNQLSRRHEAAISETATVLPRKGKSAPSRNGRVLVGGFFAPEVQTALKVTAAQERTTLQELLTEAINTVFAKRGLPEIAGLSAHQDLGEKT
jgi:hypothetical protein